MSDDSGGRVYDVTGSGGGAIRVTVSAEATVITYPQKLLALARGLIESGEFSISVVVAHIACEVATDRTFSEAFKAKDIEYLEEPIEKLLSGNNLGNDKTRRLYTALTGDSIQNQPFWSRFTSSATRRNKIAHNGAVIDKADAEESLAAAREFVGHLGK